MTDSVAAPASLLQSAESLALKLLEGWGNALEMGVIPDRHRDSAEAQSRTARELVQALAQLRKVERSVAAEVEGLREQNATLGAEIAEARQRHEERESKWRAGSEALQAECIRLSGGDGAARHTTPLTPEAAREAERLTQHMADTEGGPGMSQADRLLVARWALEVAAELAEFRACANATKLEEKDPDDVDGLRKTLALWRGAARWSNGQALAARSTIASLEERNRNLVNERDASRAARIGAEKGQRAAESALSTARHAALEQVAVAYESRATNARRFAERETDEKDRAYRLDVAERCTEEAAWVRSFMPRATPDVRPDPTAPGLRACVPVLASRRGFPLGTLISLNARAHGSSPMRLALEGAYLELDKTEGEERQRWGQVLMGLEAALAAGHETTAPAKSAGAIIAEVLSGPDALLEVLAEPVARGGGVHVEGWNEARTLTPVQTAQVAATLEVATSSRGDAPPLMPLMESELRELAATGAATPQVALVLAMKVVALRSARTLLTWLGATPAEGMLGVEDSKLHAYAASGRIPPRAVRHLAAEAIAHRDDQRQLEERVAAQPRPLVDEAAQHLLAALRAGLVGRHLLGPLVLPTWGEAGARLQGALRLAGAVLLEKLKEVGNAPRA